MNLDSLKINDSKVYNIVRSELGRQRNTLELMEKTIKQYEVERKFLIKEIIEKSGVEFLQSNDYFRL